MPVRDQTSSLGGWGDWLLYISKTEGALHVRRSETGLVHWVDEEAGSSTLARPKGLYMYVGQRPD